MPFDFSVDHDARRVTIIARDPLSVDDVLALIDRQAARAWAYPALHDGRSTTWVPNSGEIVRILSYIRTTSRRLGARRGPVAFVASDAALVGAARMYSVLGANEHVLQVMVFKDVAEAGRWLDEQQPSR